MSIICKHCGLPNKTQDDEFCCRGCGFAYQIINNLGFENYYKARHLDPKIKPLKPDEEIGNIDVSSFVTQINQDQFSINLMIEGMHCAACAWLIENILKKRTEVVKARVNMTSKKLYLEWTGQISDGNKLITLITKLGYRLLPFDAEFLKASEKKYDSSMLWALAVAGFASGNVMLISFALWANSTAQMGVFTRNLLFWVSALITLPAIVYSGRIFVISAINSIRAKRMNMDVPIAVAIVLASIISIFEAITKGEHTYFDSVIMLIFFLLIGRYLDFAARRKAFGITGDLMMLSGTSATIIEDEKNKIVAVRDLKKGMILSVALGDKIAADGVIISGEGDIDTSVITGESMPQRFKKGDEVFAGMINLGAHLQIKITKNQDETLLAKIVAMVENIENSKNYYTQIADKVAKYYTPITHLLALITFLIWCFALHSGWHHALLNAAAVLLITCPCALALAVPVAKIVSMGRLLKSGILVKNSESLEKLENIDVIIFDKTGTLTVGKPKLILDPSINNEIFRVATSMAAKSNHVLSQSLAKEFKGELIDLDVKEIAGFGLISNYNGEEIRLGNATHTGFEGDINNSDKPQIFFKYQKQITIFNFEDALRIDAKDVVKNLSKYRLILLSGDKESVVKSVANELGIKEYYFQKTPDQKLEILQKLKLENKNILMIGDGVNDAPSLTMADVSISPSSASDISRNIADIVFQGERLSPILEIFRTAHKTDRIIKENLGFSLLYNLIAVPFAIMGYIVPLFAALAMSSSSIIVVLNALRIRRS